MGFFVSLGQDNRGVGPVGIRFGGGEVGGAA